MTTTMRITQGAFSFLPDLTDAQIREQVQYCIDKGWAVNIEFTDDPHPRNTYWEMWGHPMFDIPDAAGARCWSCNECRKSLRRPLHPPRPPSTPAMAGSRCGSPSSSTGRRRSPASGSSGRRSAGRTSATPRSPTPPTAPGLRYRAGAAPLRGGVRRVGPRTRRLPRARTQPGATAAVASRIRPMAMTLPDLASGPPPATTPGSRCPTTPRPSPRRASCARRAPASREVLDELDRSLIGLAPVKTAHPRDRGAAAGRARPPQSSASPTRRRRCT